MATEMITMKLDKKFLNEIDRTAKEENYESRTEFIREAVRNRIKELNQEDLVNEFMKFRGKAKKKTTQDENEITRKQVSKELMEDLKKRFNL